MGTTLKQLWFYWVENIEAAQSWRDLTMTIVGVVVFVVGLALNILGFGQSPSFAYWIEFIGGLFFVAGLIWTPFRRHELIVAKHVEEVAALNLQVAELKERLTERAIRGRLLHDLGNHLMEIGEVIRVIEEEGPKDYVSNAHDKRMIKLIDDLMAFFHQNYGAATTALFLASRSTPELPVILFGGERRMIERQNTLQMLRQCSSWLARFIEHEIATPSPLEGTETGRKGVADWSFDDPIKG